MTAMTFPAIARETLAVYAGASGDCNAVHFDPAAARTAGFDDCFAQGMLPMAYMGRALDAHFSPEALRAFSVRFLAVTQLGASLTCELAFEEAYQEAGEERIRVRLRMIDQHGEPKLEGLAVVAAEGRR